MGKTHAKYHRAGGRWLVRTARTHRARQGPGRNAMLPNKEKTAAALIADKTNNGDVRTGGPERRTTDPLAENLRSSSFAAAGSRSLREAESCGVDSALWTRVYRSTTSPEASAEARSE
ncbi:hypothetical protein Mp_1g15300 [Marchantia polymorpha subsp. ruderalis]|uniref:Uncharacterized protein n=2 Tax=Marchantia polymorpha TaxID=3197 RepID=A0AAF6AQF1_MARPO|nr:hypothetical protein MARPO_0033s0131 [Marchantia polymorpha]BBM98671.1 hypothetical protein Mp_1g15300 [Marchantia polymorpha subsp. ruderalis]|eukprot:PTQ41737.1 hypothetical protein MARPO_0033s0131 [Marchantia polymorpha]